jgi:hypothetical protein
MQRCPTCDSEFADELEECPHCAESTAVAPAESGEVYRCSACAEDYGGSDACPACGTLREEVACETHPDRPAEGRCVVCGRAVCEECRTADRRAALCPEHAAVTVIEGWAQVYSTTSEFEAQLVRENLKAEGIDAQVYSQRDSAFSLDMGEMSIVRLLVPVWEYERALEVIRSHMDPEGEVAFACPACGEAFEPGSRECTSCGAALA